MRPPRPDLSQLDPEIVDYIEALEAELDKRPEEADAAAEEVESHEPPTTQNVITISAAGEAKRTPRHEYSRQRRGGMGVFDLQTSGDDFPRLLAVADEGDHLLLFTNLGRAFRLPVAGLPETPVRGRGQVLDGRLKLQTGERFVAAVPWTGEDSYVTLVSERGWVRRIRANYLGNSMIQGTTFHNLKEGGPLAAAARTPLDGDLFIATRAGRAIRFNGAQVPARGCLGIRVEPDDVAVAIAGVREKGGVFLLGRDGKGTIRLMSGFATNKAPGASGKIAMKTDDLVGAVSASEQDDLFIISRLSKVIRFDAGEVPAKEGVVQGVNCIALRADEVTTVTAVKREIGERNE